MKESAKDKVEGEIHEVKGKVKEKIGKATYNPDLEAEGQEDKDRRESPKENRPGGESPRDIVWRDLLHPCSALQRGMESAAQCRSHLEARRTAVSL